MNTSANGIVPRTGLSATGGVRASRDGDRFHYLWAATRLLHLLAPAGHLYQVTIEGLGTSPRDYEPDGAEVIDLVEYYGDPKTGFTSLEVRQFKYSSSSPNRSFTLGDVKKVEQKFLLLDPSLRKNVPGAEINYSIVTNTPFSQRAINYVTSKRDETVHIPSQPLDARELGNSVSRFSPLLGRISLHGNEPSTTALRTALDQSTTGFTADRDVRISSALIELVASRASTETSGPITRSDILAAFGCDESDLAPAPCKLEDSPYIPREAYKDLANQILSTPGAMILTAEGGSGKSTFSRALPDLLRNRADVVIYDCFGGGSYRNSAYPRHRHRDGLVQIATELSGVGLSLPIVQAGPAQPAEYLKAFIRRLEAASEVLKSKLDSHLVIVVDAADSAVIASEEYADSAPFVRDLLHLDSSVPDNIHIVLTCRPERAPSLSAPELTPTLEMPNFATAETAYLVRSKHSAATEQDIVEIHERSAGNPRVISTLLDGTSSILDSLRRLTSIEGNPISVHSLLHQKVTRIFEDAGDARPALERVSQLLTQLRPSVPVGLLSDLAGTSVPSVRSFISDLGQGLVLEASKVRFLDEPTESYFRDSHHATSSFIAEVAGQLGSLSSTSTYAALALPSILWNAELHDQLLELVTGQSALPEANAVVRERIDYLRVEFGLRAAARLRRPLEITKLALRAGTLREGNSRRYSIIENNPDLAGQILDPLLVHELVAAREIPRRWPGSSLGAEASLLAHTTGFESSARTRCRYAINALSTWANSPNSTSSGEITDSAAHIALSLYRTDGAASLEEFINRWRSPNTQLKICEKLAYIIVSRAEHEAVATLVTETSNAPILLALLSELSKTGFVLEAEATRTLWAKLNGHSTQFEEYTPHRTESVAGLPRRGIAWLCALATRHRIVSPKSAAELLEKYMPASMPQSLNLRFGTFDSGLLFAVALRSELLDQILDVTCYQPEKNATPNEELERYLTPAIAWLDAWAKLSCGRFTAQSAIDLAKTCTDSFRFDSAFSTANRISRVVLPQLAVSFDNEVLRAICEDMFRRMSEDAPVIAALDIIPRLKGDPRYEDEVLELADTAASELARSKSSAEERSDLLIRIARGIFPYSSREAAEYFTEALESAAGVGDDVHERWQTTMALAKASAGALNTSESNIGAVIATVAEALEKNIYGQIDERQLVASVVPLVGEGIFQLLSQWRDRRFGSLESQLTGLAQSGDSTFEDHIELMALLTPFTESYNLGSLIEKVKSRGELDTQKLRAFQRLASRLGRSAELFEVEPEPNSTRESSSPRISNSATHSVCPERPDDSKINPDSLESFSKFDLTQVEDFDTAVEMQRNSRFFDGTLLTSAILSRPSLERESILNTALNSRILREHELADILNCAFGWPRKSRSFVAGLKRALQAYIDRYPLALVTNHSRTLDIHSASEFLGCTVAEITLAAICNLNFEADFLHADQCYRLAATASELLSCDEAMLALDEAIKALAGDLDVSLVNEIVPLTPTSTEKAVAGFLWTALGDPRSEVRWQAVHAIRTAIEIGDPTFMGALCRALIGGEDREYVDSRLPFYKMTAVEWFLIAAKRAAQTSPESLVSLLPAFIHFNSEYPDHAAIQMHCHEIALLIPTGDIDAIGTDWGKVLKSPSVMTRFERPYVPKPFMHGAPKTEYHFHFDFDEYVLGEITQEFQIAHQEVIDAASSIILDEWGWRSDSNRPPDPRGQLNIYHDEDTYRYKWRVPKDEDLHFYLERHAALVLAGRLMRNSIPYQDLTETEPGILRWLEEYQLARDDKRWIVDQRSSTPKDLVTHDYLAHEAVSDTDYFDALFPEPGWVIVEQSAHQEIGRDDAEVHIESALTGVSTVHALVRSLQARTHYSEFRLPSSDEIDEDFQFSAPPFELHGWISVPYSESGIDRLDRHSKQLSVELPRPAANIAQALGITPSEGGTHWKGSDEITVMAAQTWAESSRANEQPGTYGTRLKVKENELIQLLTEQDCALIVTVQIRRTGSDKLKTQDQPEKVFKSGSQDFRAFAFIPYSGWYDYHGSLGPR